MYVGNQGKRERFTETTLNAGERPPTFMYEWPMHYVRAESRNGGAQESHIATILQTKSRQGRAPSLSSTHIERRVR